MERVEVRLIDLPTSIRGFTAYSEEASGEPIFTIILNARMDRDTQLRAYEHELIHIKRMDFSSMVPADHIEAIRHKAM